MNERLQQEGHLRQRELKAKELELKMTGLRDSIRSRLDPWKPLEELQTEVAAAQAVELSMLQGQYKTLLTEIAGLRRELGE